MKNKLLYILGMILNILIIIGTILFGIMNFENVTCFCEEGLIIYTDSSSSLHTRYHDWIEDYYGTYKGEEIIHQTLWIIEHNTNKNMIVVIGFMMLCSIWINKMLNKKMNKVLRRYFVFWILLMLFATYVAGPEYFDLIYEEG